MASAIAIRDERPGDEPTITSIVKRAYAEIPYSDHREHLMIERLRATNAYTPSLSLLAEIAGEAVGHLLLTTAHIRNERSTVTTLALAPLSVVPDFQSRGVGRHLVVSAHQRAAALGFGTIIVIGLPGYYPRFGYDRLSRYPITLPFDAPDENCMILPVRAGALDGVSGRVHYADGWLDH